MRRPLVTVVSALVLAACGGEDVAQPEATTFVPGPEPVGSTTPVVVTVAEGVCEDTPDPAAYPEGQRPPIIPPCEVPTELAIHTIRSGSGPAARDGDRVVIDYTGLRSDDGAVFDSSYERDAPFEFQLGRGGVIAGWDQGLLGAQAGALVKLDVPPGLAYGDSPPAGEVIRPGDALTFVAEIRAVIQSVTPDDAPLDIAIQPSLDATGVTTEDLVVGDGVAVEAGDTAVAHILIVRGDNQVVVFDTWKRDEPIQIVMTEGGSIPGVIEGLEGATVGTRRVISMPPELAFGEEGQPGLGIPAGVDVIVVADVIGAY